MTSIFSFSTNSILSKSGDVLNVFSKTVEKLAELSEKA